MAKGPCLYSAAHDMPLQLLVVRIHPPLWPIAIQLPVSFADVRPITHCANLDPMVFPPEHWGVLLPVYRESDGVPSTHDHATWTVRAHGGVGAQLFVPHTLAELDGVLVASAVPSLLPTEP